MKCPRCGEEAYFCPERWGSYVCVECGWQNIWQIYFATFVFVGMILLTYWSGILYIMTNGDDYAGAMSLIFLLLSVVIAYVIAKSIVFDIENEPKCIIGLFEAIEVGMNDGAKNNNNPQ